MIKTGVIQNGDGDAVPRRNPWLTQRATGNTTPQFKKPNTRAASIVPLGSTANFNHVGHILAEWKEPPILSLDVA